MLQMEDKSFFYELKAYLANVKLVEKGLYRLVGKTFDVNVCIWNIALRVLLHSDSMTDGRFCIPVISTRK